MVRPPVLKPSDEVKTIGRIFGTPLVVKGRTWLPLVEWVVWGVMTYVAGKRRPDRSIGSRLGVGLLTMLVVVGSEWGHNFAHALTAWLIRKPMDALRITWGTPLVVYYDLEEGTVTPREHVIRALGGPVFNALVFCVVQVIRRWTRSGTLGREVLDTAVATNGFLSTVALLPLPIIDGGPILKWTLVARGRTPAQADKVVRKVNGVLGSLLGVGSVGAFKRRRWVLGAFLAQISVMSLGIALGILREK